MNIPPIVLLVTMKATFCRKKTRSTSEKSSEPLHFVAYNPWKRAPFGCYWTHRWSHRFFVSGDHSEKVKQLETEATRIGKYRGFQWRIPKMVVL